MTEYATSPGLKVVTAHGEFSIDLQHQRAPRTCGYFLKLADTGQLDETSVFRIVTPENEPEDANAISVVQLGMRGELASERVQVPHESTQITGLRHRQWTVSAARFHVGELYGSFFICMRDEPCLDHGGERNPDQEGFAAFGKVTDGFETLEQLYRLAESTAMLAHPIPVYRVEPLPG